MYTTIESNEISLGQAFQITPEAGKKKPPLSFFRETLFHPVFFIVNSRDIDNPLNPWVQVYKGELKLEEGAHFHDRPALDIVIRKFRAAKLTAYTAGLFFTVSKLFGVVIILCMRK